jgi:hypothetical protein
MDKTVLLPKYLQESIRPLKQGFPKRVKALVFDTETCEGSPYLLTFYNGEKVSFFRVQENTILEEFFRYLLEHCTSRKHSYILYCHNLPFDISAVFDCHRQLFSFRTARFILKDKNSKKTIAQAKFFTNKVWFLQIKLWNGVSVKVVDTASFMKGSLYQLSRTLRFKYVKRERPFFVEQGKKPLNRKEWLSLYRYCFDEIKAQYELAKYVLETHERYNVPFTVSVAQLASKIFRKHFLKEHIPQIPDHIRTLAEQTIHGGRAGIFVPVPCLVANVSMYDYNSFYPYSMANLPNITKGEWKKVDSFDYEHEGFYRISGFVKPCKYPIIIKSLSSMDYASNEFVSNIPVSSYELREALETQELDLKKLEGYVWLPHNEAKNPFKDYVLHFYQEKENYEKGSPLYIKAKLLLNSLYGKCYQTLIDPRSENREDYRVYPEDRQIRKIEKFYKAGGLYLPHVGSWITSQTRAILHRDLHNFQGLDCATDSFKTPLDLPVSEELGMLKKECEGFLLLLRPKLYVMFSKDRQREILQHGDFIDYLKREFGSFSDKDFVKYALHGFQRNIYTLLDMVAQDRHEYYSKHMRTIREALRQQKQPRVMITQKRSLNVNWKALETPLLEVRA